jgi:hypothetical protein
MITLAAVCSFAVPVLVSSCACTFLFGRSKKQSKLPEPPKPKGSGLPEPPKPKDGLPAPPSPKGVSLPEPPKPEGDVPKPPIVSGLNEPPKPSVMDRHAPGPVIRLPDPKFFPVEDEDEPESVIKVPRPRIPSDPEKRNAVMDVVRALEKALDLMHEEDMLGDERKWYNKVKIEIENIKKAVDQGDADRARRCLSSAELYIKMLELNSSGR